MSNKLSRRNILASGITLLGTTFFANSRANAIIDDSDLDDSDLSSPGSQTSKTREASCNCGQLSVTCVGPDPERISLCHCYLCQKQSGSAFAIQARFPKEQVTIRGESTVWRFPIEGENPVPYRNCASGGASFHFCAECGATVYYTSDQDDQRIGIKVGTFADPTFPPPKITGFEEYRHPWVMNLKKLAMKVVS